MREDNLCTLITFLSRFRANLAQDPNEKAQWTIYRVVSVSDDGDDASTAAQQQQQSLSAKQHIQHIEHLFFEKTKTKVQEQLQTLFNARIVVQEGAVQATTGDDSSNATMMSVSLAKVVPDVDNETDFLSNQQLLTLMKQVSDEIETNVRFDFDSQVKQVLKSGIEVLMQWCPYLDKTELQMIKIDPIVFSGLEDLVPYEIDFMGSARMIIYPDANLFSEAHIAYIGKKTCDDELWYGASMRTKTLVSYRYECLFNILHEMVHCVQTALGQSDPSAWILEHDACRLALCLMGAIAQREELKHGLFVPGKEEEAILYISDLVHAAHKVGVTDEQNDGYLKWRESYGLCAPVPVDAFDFANDNITVADYFKYRVGLEAYLVHRRDSKCTEAMIHTSFKNRTGNLAKMESFTVPHEVTITEQENLF